MRRLLFLVLLLVASCANPYSPMDMPPAPRPNGDSEIISYIDKRLEEEYYWLDEVKQKSEQFDRRQPWDKYLNKALSKLTTNSDDGGFNSQGQRTYYSYFYELGSTTRAEVQGFGIVLHYTILIMDSDRGRYGFVVDAVYPDSPADKAGLKRGDIIIKVGGAYLDSSNYVASFNGIQLNTMPVARIEYMRRSEQDEQQSVTLSQGAYHENPVVHSEIIELSGSDIKIGYLVYMGFESEYDEVLLAALSEFAAAGIEELILDLRCNRGGAINSAVKLCSAIVPNSYEGQLWCSIRRNKNNNKMPLSSEFRLQNTGSILNMSRVTIICSDCSASASELVIMGLRGLEFPVRLIGARTEGKNCGMDVTRKRIGGKDYEYAPITFMCFNAKGFGDWGEGIEPDVDLTIENKYGVSDEHYPLPYADWGDMHHDIALAVALADVTGSGISSTTRSVVDDDFVTTITMARPVVGAKIYVEE